MQTFEFSVAISCQSNHCYLNNPILIFDCLLYLQDFHVNAWILEHRFWCVQNFEFMVDTFSYWTKTWKFRTNSDQAVFGSWWSVNPCGHGYLWSVDLSSKIVAWIRPEITIFWHGTILSGLSYFKPFYLSRYFYILTSYKLCKSKMLKFCSFFLFVGIVFCPNLNIRNSINGILNI